MSDFKMKKNDEKRTPTPPIQEENADGLEITTRLEEGAQVNAEGVPTYVGLSGTRLIAAITATATTGFLLFG